MRPDEAAKLLLASTGDDAKLAHAVVEVALAAHPENVQECLREVPHGGEIGM